MQVQAVEVKTKTRRQKTSKKRQQTFLGRLRALPWTTWLFLAVIIFFATLRFRLRDMPLERDEGEYAYSGQLMLQGVPPYQLAYNMKLPGTYAAYALSMAIFGQTSSGIRLGLLLINAATSVLVFALGKKLFGKTAAVVSGITYALLSISPSMFGIVAHAEHFVIFPALAGILILLYAIEADRRLLFFCSGTLLGLAFLMKQPGIAFAAFAFFYFIYRSWKQPIDWQYLGSRGGILFAGVVWPFALTCLLLYSAGVFSKFWFWTFSYARAYGSEVRFVEGLEYLLGSLRGIFPLSNGIGILALAGLIMIFRRRDMAALRSFVLGLLFFSFVGVSAGFYFRNHYFVLLLPVVALLTGVAIEYAVQALQQRQFGPLVLPILTIIFGLAIVASVYRDAPVLFSANSIEACHRMYRNNPFPEAQQIAEYLKSNSSPDARLAVLGSEPEIYFYSQRHSVTGYIYTYGLMEDQAYAGQMQQEMIHEVTNARPEYVAFVDADLSWLWQRGGSQDAFFQWVQMLINTQYVKAAQVDIPGTAKHMTGPVARIYLFRRKAQ